MDWKRMAGWLRRRANDFVVLLLASMFASFLLQVVFRYLLDLPLGWSVEYVSIAWLWGILFGYAFVISDADIIRFDLVYNAFPPRGRRVMTIVSSAIVALIFALSLPAAAGYVMFMGIERTAFLLIRFDLVFMVYVAFGLSVIARAIWEIVEAIRGHKFEQHHTGMEHDSHV
ncbi:MAG: TRAP transporter small permease subunit [Rhizobiaceae bacterium]